MRITHGRFLHEFYAIDGDLAEGLVSLGEEMAVKEGDMLPVKGVHIVLTGIVAIRAVTVQGADVMLSFRGSGGLIGETAALDGPPEHITLADAMTDDVRIVVLTEHVFRGYVEDHPEMWRALAAEWSERLATAEGRLCSVATENADRRLARLLLSLPRDTYGPLPLSKAELASWVGVARETVERILKNWRQRGIVRTGYRTLFILDRRSLVRIAGIVTDPAVGSRTGQRGLRAG